MSNQLQTSYDLVELTKLQKQVTVPIDPVDYKYVIYARKSTDNSEQQVRSLSDQLAACRELAAREGYRVMGEILESESAKEPDTRPKFRKLLEDVKSGKVDGIISWHPDRLARNMKEAGEVIDMLDKDTIKSLKFASFSFQNDTSGKTLLGITFVLSKQYSDNLSDNINRGIYRSIIEGKSIGKVPHGYYRDANFYLWPDGDNFLIIKKAFAMRSENQSLEAIVKYLNASGYRQSVKDGHQSYRFSVQRVSDLFKRKVYAGVLEHGDYVIALSDVYSFDPMISVSEFCRINNITADALAVRNIINKKTKLTMMRGLIKCGYCGHPMTSAITHKHNKAKTKKTLYYYYRCDNKTPSCKNNKSRAYKVLDYVYNLLDEHLFVSAEAFDSYTREMLHLTELKVRDADRVLKSLQHQYREAQESVNRHKQFLLDERDGETKDTFKADLKVKQEELRRIQIKIDATKELKSNPKKAFMNFQEFIELFKNTAMVLRKAKDLEAKDAMLREIFLNLTLKDEKIVDCSLKEPFNTFVEKGFFRLGGDGRNRTAV